MTVRLIEGVMKMKLAGKVAIVTGGGIGIDVIQLFVG